MSSQVLSGSIYVWFSDDVRPTGCIAYYYDGRRPIDIITNARSVTFKNGNNKKKGKEKREQSARVKKKTWSKRHLCRVFGRWIGQKIIEKSELILRLARRYTPVRFPPDISVVSHVSTTGVGTDWLTGSSRRAFTRRYRNGFYLFFSFSPLLRVHTARYRRRV